MSDYRECESRDLCDEVRLERDQLLADNTRMRGALKHIGGELASYETEKRRPIKDELFALLSWALRGLGGQLGESGENDHDRR